MFALLAIASLSGFMLEPNSALAFQAQASETESSRLLRQRREDSVDRDSDSVEIVGLESQLAMIDYRKDNFAHADLSPEELQQKMAERGDTALTVGLSAISELIRNQNRAMQRESQQRENQQTGSQHRSDSPESAASQLTSDSLLEMMSNPNKMKLMMTSQFASEGAMEQGLGQTLNQLLVTDRNEAAMRVLQQQLASGKTKIAVFYGAAHMTDFEQRLVGDFGLTKTDQVWVDAWDLQKEVESTASSPLNLMMQMLKALDE